MSQAAMSHLDPHVSDDLTRPGRPLCDVVWVDPGRVSGAPCFAGTRVPLQCLFDHIEGGDTLEQFLEAFPGVTRAQAVAVLEQSRRELFDRLKPA
jgi:uncharacterized protein (DUF433 family)